MAEKSSVLLVEPTHSGYSRFLELLGGSSVRVYRATCPSEAVSLLCQIEEEYDQPPKIMVTGLLLEDKPSDGLNLIRAVRKTHPDISIAAWTKYGEEYLQKAYAVGANFAFRKGIDDEALRDVVITRVCNESERDWTVDPQTGRSNSSPKFEQLVSVVDSLLRAEAVNLVGGRTREAACLIVAQLAHVHGLAPQKR